MSEFMQKLVVALISIVGSLVVAYLVYVFYQKPALELARHATAQAQQEKVQAQQERAAAAAKGAEAEKRAAAAEERFDKMQEAWNNARNKFVDQMAGDMACVMRDPRTWEGKPHPSPRDCAQQLVTHRNEARQRTLQVSNEVKADMIEVYRNLDGEIDALQALLARRPPTPEADIIALVARLNNGWANKVALISRAAPRRQGRAS
jgi:hypothetical protein